jgi:hypothetical protein
MVLLKQQRQSCEALPILFPRFEPLALLWQSLPIVLAGKLAKNK